jgi:hypothetical protein
MKGDERVIRLLLENGAQPYLGDEKGLSGGPRAIEKGTLPSFLAVRLFSSSKAVIPVSALLRLR